MKCYACEARAVALDTRDVDGVIERRRACSNGHRFVTQEAFVRDQKETAARQGVAKKCKVERVERIAPKRDEVLAAIRAAGVVGIRAFELKKVTGNPHADEAARKLKAMGAVATRLEQTKVARYFADEATASQWKRPALVSRGDSRFMVVPAKPSVDAPVKTKPHRPTGEQVTTAGTKITRCEPWTHDKRFQLPPGTKVNGEFSSLPIGRYLDDATA